MLGYTIPKGTMLVSNLWRVLVVLQSPVTTHSCLKIGQSVETQSNTRTQTNLSQNDSSKVMLTINRWILDFIVSVSDDGMYDMVIRVRNTAPALPMNLPNTDDMHSLVVCALKWHDTGSAQVAISLTMLCTWQ